MQYSLLPQESRNLLPFQGEVTFYPNFFSMKEADGFFQVLQDRLAWQQEPIWIFGKQVLQPRLTALYGDPKVPYGYSGIAMEASPFHEELEQSRTACKPLPNRSLRMCSATITVTVRIAWVGIETMNLSWEKSNHSLNLTFGATDLFNCGLTEKRTQIKP
jgi:hypothetical protein